MSGSSKRYFFVFLSILVLLVAALGVDGLRTFHRASQTGAQPAMARGDAAIPVSQPTR